MRAPALTPANVAHAGAGRILRRSCSRRAPSARAAQRSWQRPSAALRRHLAWRAGSAAGRGLRGRHDPSSAIPTLDVPYPQPLAPLRGGRRRSLGRRSRRHACRHDGAERARTRDRPRDHERAARCRRGPGMALSSTPPPGATLARVRRACAWRSLRLFAAGAFSARAERAVAPPMPRALAALDAATLAQGFQVERGQPARRPRGPRARCCVASGSVMPAATPAVFGTPARLGHLYDYLRRACAAGSAISAGFLLATLLRALGPVWPPRLALDGVPLGDCWRHPAATPDPRSDRRLRAVPQAHAVARVLAARAARGSRHLR